MRRPAGTGIVGGAAVVAVVVLLAVASVPWTRRFDSGLQRPLWTAGGACAIGAAVAVVGAGLVALAQLARLTSTTANRLAALGVVTAALGTGFALVDLHAPGVPEGAITVAIGRFRRGPDQFPPAGPSAAVVPTVLFVVAGSLLVLAVVGALVRTGAADVDTSRATRPVTGVATAGAALVAVGASVLPWSVDTDLTAAPLWRSSADTAVAAGVLLAAAVGSVLLVHRRPAPRTAVLLALVAGVAGAVVVGSRSTYVGRSRSSPFYSFLRTPSTAGIPSETLLHAATLTVLAGAGLVVLAALAAVSLSVVRGADVGAVRGSAATPPATG